MNRERILYSIEYSQPMALPLSYTPRLPLLVPFFDELLSQGNYVISVCCKFLLKDELATESWQLTFTVAHLRADGDSGDKDNWIINWSPCSF